jgi:hypothetical protein
LLPGHRFEIFLEGYSFLSELGNLPQQALQLTKGSFVGSQFSRPQDGDGFASSENRVLPALEFNGVQQIGKLSDGLGGRDAFPHIGASTENMIIRLSDVAEFVQYEGGIIVHRRQGFLFVRGHPHSGRGCEHD